MIFIEKQAVAWVITRDINAAIIGFTAINICQIEDLKSRVITQATAC